MRYKVIEHKMCEICGKTITQEEINDRDIVISQYNEREDRFHCYHLKCYLEGAYLNENPKGTTQRHDG